MITITLVLSALLVGFLIYKKATGTRKIRVMSPCGKCKSDVNYLVPSFERPGMEICSDCGWEEHGRLFNAPWATHGHT